jgi:cation transport regulator ChaC
MGRVVTLVKSNLNDRVYGVAYELDRNSMDKTFEHLHFREKCGYSLNEIKFYPLDHSISNGVALNCVCYFANEENPYYSPENNYSLIAAQIFASRGPSGENSEYLLNLCKALRHFAHEYFHSDGEGLKTLIKYDEHLFELERLVLEMISKEKS